MTLTYHPFKKCSYLPVRSPFRLLGALRSVPLKIPVKDNGKRSRCDPLASPIHGQVADDPLGPRENGAISGHGLRSVGQAAAANPCHADPAKPRRIFVGGWGEPIGDRKGCEDVQREVWRDFGPSLLDVDRLSFLEVLGLHSTIRQMEKG